MFKYPYSKKENIKEIHFGQTIKDPYRWMENEEDPALESWIDAQNQLTQSVLSQMPGKAQIKSRLKELYDYEKYNTLRLIGDHIVYSMNTGLQNQYVYYIQKGLEGEPHLLLDPNTLSEDGTVAVTLNGWSEDNRYLACLKSASGSDWQEIMIIDLERKKILDDVIKHVKFTLVSWRDDGFYYSSYEQPEKGKELSAKNENMKVYYHKIGTVQAEDILIFEDSHHPLRYNSLRVSKDAKNLILNISEGTYGNEVRIKEAKEDGSFKVLFKGFSSEHEYLGECEEWLYFLTDQDAFNKKIVKVNRLTNEVSDFVKESALNLEGAWKFGEAFVLLYLKDVVSQVHFLDKEGNLLNKWQLPGIGMVYEMSSSKDSEHILFSYGSFVSPLSLLCFNKKTYEISNFKSSKLSYDETAFETTQLFCESKDGTKVPVFLTHKKGLVLDGKRPTLLYAYGGFNVSLPPGYNPANVFLIEQGGVYAQANIRGGSEYGESWHREGMLLKKQNVFDDFIAVAESLIDQGYTSPENLSIQGGSNGGLLMGAVLNQRPDLFKAVFPQVGVMDMLRYHLFTIGWGWMVEYGNPEEEVHFKNLLSYSPLHNIESKAYPSVMVMTADHDDRVVPAHSFKYIARLQEMNTSDKPMLIRIDKNAGHGAGKSIEKIIDEQTDKFTFMGLGSL